VLKPSSFPGRQPQKQDNELRLQVGPIQTIERGQFRVAKSSALRDAFALGVLTGFYGKKLHGAIVEAAFFKPNLYAHLPAVSFVD
jgi:hypothetical protein